MPISGDGWDMPAASNAWNDFTWFKVPASRTLVLVMLSESPVWYAGHFWRQRMRPCQGENCKLCADGVGAQLRYVLVGMEVSIGTVGLIELSRTVALELRDLGDKYNGLRGLCVEIGKVSHSKNSRMSVVAHPGHEIIGWASKEMPDIRTALRNTWLKAGEIVPSGFEEVPNPIIPRGLRQPPMVNNGTQEPEKGASGGKSKDQAARPTFRVPTAVR
jgi:hypothetical protein